MWQAGIMQHIVHMFRFRHSIIQRRKAIEENRQPPPPASDKIQLVHISGGFVIIALGSFVALLALGLEKYNQMEIKFN